MTDSRFTLDTADEMREFGAALARYLDAGDLVVLTGDLGAGKTTLTQGIARGLGITDAVTSPTFVIARSHENATGRPSLVHVDAYRLSSLGELDDLDLEHDLGSSVVVVEWGGGLVDDLSESRLLLNITRSDDPGDEQRVVAAQADAPRLATGLAHLAAEGPTW